MGFKHDYTNATVPVTMAEIDALRGSIADDLDRLREAQFRLNSLTEPEYFPYSKMFVNDVSDTKARIANNRAKVEKMLAQWAKQGYKDYAQVCNFEQCDCGFVGTHRKGFGPCYNTGDAIGDLDRIMAIPNLGAQAACYTKWKRNYVKVAQSVQEVPSSYMYGYYAKGDEGKMLDAMRRQARLGIANKVKDAADVTGPSQGGIYDNVRIHATMTILTNKKVD